MSPSPQSEMLPFDRLSARLNGLDALSVVAHCAITSEFGPPAQAVWESLWFSIGLAVQDMRQDLLEVREAIRSAAAQRCEGARP